MNTLRTSPENQWELSAICRGGPTRYVAEKQHDRIDGCSLVTRLETVATAADLAVLEKCAGCVDPRSRAAAAGTILSKSDFLFASAAPIEQRPAEVIGSRSPPPKLSDARSGASRMTLFGTTILPDCFSRRLPSPCGPPGEIGLPTMKADWLRWFGSDNSLEVIQCPSTTFGSV